MKRIIVDLDNTLSINRNGNYAEAEPIQEVINKLNQYKAAGFEIVIFSSRNMRTYEANIGKINVFTLPVIIEWLNKFNVPYDEIYVGKVWCGNDGFYVDDRAVRPKEFVNLTYNDILKLIQKDKFQ